MEALMAIKNILKQTFKNKLLKPQLKRMDAWEQTVIDRPKAVRGGENSPVRFNIPREGLELEGDHPPLPGFPKSVPQIAGSISNIRRSVLDLDKNPANGKCFPYFMKYHGCSICIKVCPFNQQGYDKIKEGFLHKKEKLGV